MLPILNNHGVLVRQNNIFNVGLTRVPIFEIRGVLVPIHEY